MRYVMRKSAELSVRWRWLVIILFPIGIILFSSKAANIYFANSPEMWFLPGEKVVEEYQIMKDKFGDSQPLLVGVEVKDGTVLDSSSMDALARIHSYLEGHDQVTSIISLVNYEYTRTVDGIMEVQPLIEDPESVSVLLKDISESKRIKSILKDERIALDDLVTRDFKNTIIVAKTKVSEDGRTADHVALVNEFEEFLSAENFTIEGVTVHIFGRPFISHAFASGAGKDQGISYPLIFVTTCILLALLFRRVRAIVFPWITIIGGLLIVFSIQGALRWPTTAATASIPYLIITVSVGLTVHIMIEYFRFLGKGLDSKIAAVKAIDSLSKALMFTTFTTLIGFTGLAMTKMLPLREYAVLGILGISATFFLSITLFPALLSFMKIAPSWARKANPRSNFLALFSRMGRRFSGALVVLGGVLLVGSVVATLNMKMDINFVNMFKEDSRFRTEFSYFDKVFNGGQSIDLVVDSGRDGGIYNPEFLRKVSDLESFLGNIDGLGKPTSLLAYMKEINMRLNSDNASYWAIASSEDVIAQQVFLYENSSSDSNLSEMYSIDQRYLKVTSRATNMSANETRVILDKIDREINTNYQDLNILVTGDLALFNTLETYISMGMVSAFGFSLLCILICFLIIFRSVRSAAITLIPSVFPVFVGGAVMSIFGISPDLNTLIVASITLGIAVDDSIHYKTRYDNGIQQGLSVDDAIDEACQGAGYGMFMSTLILLIGFSVFLVGEMQSSIYFGALAMLILVTALITDLIFMPALLKRWGNRQPVVITSSKSDTLIISPQKA